jgi:hypothetical protein
MFACGTRRALPHQSWPLRADCIDFLPVGKPGSKSERLGIDIRRFSEVSVRQGQQAILIFGLYAFGVDLHGDDQSPVEDTRQAFAPV